MTNKIPYNCYPDRSEFCSLYMTKSQQELCDYYKCNKKRIHKWILHFGLTLRVRGGGNNRKFNVCYELLKEFVESGLSNKDISEKLGMSKSNVSAWLKKYNIKRNYNKKEYEIYSRKVRFLTETNYAKYKEILNPNNYPRTLCGVVGGYQLDHIVSVRECFDSGISIEDCAKIDNLQIIPWQKNLKKRKFKRGKQNDKSG